MNNIYTNYKNDEISEFKVKYKKEIRMRRVIYILLIFIIVFAYRVIPNSCDSFAYYDEMNNYYYFFETKKLLVNMLICISVLLIVSIPLFFKRLLKENYIEFLVAIKGRNLHKNKLAENMKLLICIILVLVCLYNVVYSAFNINDIVLTNKAFYVHDRENFKLKFKEYNYDYLENHTINNNNEDIWFCEVGMNEEGQYIKEDLYIGKNSEQLKTMYSEMLKKRDLMSK